jgi:DNA-binding IscR family transcriptional regulator
MHSRRFFRALDLLILLDRLDGRRVSSYWLAVHLGEQREYVRRLLDTLARAGLVSCRAGYHGGARLEPQRPRLTLDKIYRAVTPADLFGDDPSPRSRSNHPSRHLSAALVPVIERATQAFARELASVSLAELGAELERRETIAGCELRRRSSAVAEMAERELARSDPTSTRP